MALCVAHKPHLLPSVCARERPPSALVSLQYKVQPPWKTPHKRSAPLPQFALGQPLFPPRRPKGSTQEGVAGTARYSKLRMIIASAIRSTTDSSSKEKYVETGARNFENRGSYFKRKDDIPSERRAAKGSKAAGGRSGGGGSRIKGYFRIFRVEVLLERDLGKDHFEVSDAVLESTAAALACSPGMLPRSALSVVRKSFDARKDPKFVYTVELDTEECLRQKPESKSFLSKLRAKPSKLEFSKVPSAPLDLISRLARAGESSSNSLGSDAGFELEASKEQAPSSDPEERRGASRASTTGRGTGQISLPPKDRPRLHNSMDEKWRMKSHHQHEPFAIFTLGRYTWPFSKHWCRRLNLAILHINPAEKEAILLSMGRGPIFHNFRKERANVVVVGSGPAGLFAALVLAETGAKVTIVERGQPVEGRGKDIGALMVRRLLDADSNLCYGEGGAGTWSDGKLTTRIGKNGGSVQTVLATLVRFGAPANILVDGKPHVGTDRLVHILRAFRQHLHTLGVTLLFGTRMDDFIVRDGRLVGIHISPVTEKSASSCPSTLEADAVVLGVGHSARDVYDSLRAQNVLMTAKDFAVGFRVEHPQELINEIQYHKWASEVQRGKGKVPVADYKVSANIDLSEPNSLLPSDEMLTRGCYSFCMCPGGQIVPTSTDEAELCINGMSFSKRASNWANAALVVTVPHTDFAPLVADHGPLAGIAFQRAIEREAAVMGGGKLVAPAQTVPDFLEDRLSGHELPSSSYRLGVRASPLHELLPSQLTNTLKQALVAFDSQLPGFIDRRALLHGVETRTSSPVRIERNKDTFESVSLPGLYPIGEGAGYAGGIVSAAVDGMLAGFALARQFNPELQTTTSNL